MHQKQSLNGTWQLIPVEQFAQGYYPLGDEAWLTQELPAHWQQHEQLERHAGRVVYRRRFAGPDMAEGRRAWLRLNGAFYWSQPFLNGVDLGRHEGYFTPQEHEVTALLQPENSLVVEVECPDEHDQTGKRLITGVFSHWDSIDPETNPGGIWLPVELIETGPVRIGQTLLTTESAGDAAAELRYRATLDAAGARDVTLRWTIAPHNFAGAVQLIEERRALADGRQTLVGRLTVRDPQLWWTHDMGHPNLYRITLEVLCGDDASDASTISYGIRTFHMKEWVAHLNGVRLFIKGSNYPPGDTRIATMTRDRYDEDMRLAQQCHMNMLRVHAHVDHPELYAAADAAGVLIWQDFPLQWLYRREALEPALAQAAEMVELLHNHASVALWCMHNEPIFTADTKDQRWLTRLRIYYSVFIYSWSRDLLDTRLQEVVAQADRSRPVVRSSGEYAVPLWRKGTDAHFYYGWYPVYGKLWTWPKLIKQFPNLIRFVTEFGSQSFPNYESAVKFMDADIRKVDWDRLVRRHHFQPEILANWVDWRAAGSLQELIDLTQDYQIMIHRFYTDRLRLAKYRPNGGIIPFMFHDSNPAVQWSVIDYWRVPKRSFWGLRLAFSPQYLFCVTDRETGVVGQPLELPIYVVNDAHAAVGAGVRATLRGPDGRELAQLARDLTLPADCMAIELERLRLTPEAPGTYRLELTLRPEGGEELVNSYEIPVRG